MKNWKLFIIVFFSSVFTASACGFSPFGEDIRFSLFLPKYIKVQGYESFCYHSDLLYYEESESIFSANVLDWYQFTGKQVDISHIKSFFANYDYRDINEKSDNLFVQFLYKNKQYGVLKYLINAKKTEPFNSVLFENDAWELQQADLQSQRGLFIKKLENDLQQETDVFLQRKYAFLIIRLAYYNNDLHKIEHLFEKYFKNSNQDYLYYWSLYFFCFTDKATSLDIANVFEHSEDKRYASFYYFRDKFNLNEALQLAKNSYEKASVYAFVSIQKVDRNLKNLKGVYQNNPGSKSLEALLLREINKLEDWIYTPYYTNYLPSTVYTFWNDSQKETMNTLKNRSENDRLYAKEVLDFVENVNFEKTNNPLLWKAAEIQLLFMTRVYDQCLQKIEMFVKENQNEEINEQFEQIKALCLVGKQQKGKAEVTKDIQNIVLNQSRNAKFLFALGRELEYRENYTDGLALISYADKIGQSIYDYDHIFWRGNRLRTSGNLDYFYSYFDYLDFVYDAQELKKVLDTIDLSRTNPYQKTIFGVLKNDYLKLKDLLGTKFLRENNLPEAYAVFKSMGDGYWEENYNAWERTELDYGYHTFEQNPFYDFKYTTGFIPHQEKFIVSKLSVVDHLLKFEKLANNTKNPDRDYYYFIIANCYYNMSDEGNSWVMRRFSSTSDYWSYSSEYESYIDEAEYRNRLLAQNYYRLAYQNAKSDKFKALCLRMEELAADGYPSQFPKVKEEFPEYYKDLSSCYSLNQYFLSRAK